MLIKPLASYEFSESIVKVGDVFHRTDYSNTYAVSGIYELSWKVGKKKTKKCEHKLELFQFQTGKSISVDTAAFRKHYLVNKSCKRIWSIDVINERNDC